jgi:aspartyl/asparaginyl-tRNA synthetase
MKLEYLINYKKEEFETVDTFCKHVLETAKRVCPSLMISKNDTYKIITLLAKYYKIEYNEVIDIIKEIEFGKPSKKYILELFLITNHSLFPNREK